MAEYLKNKQQLALNNENLNKILADLEGLPGGANLNIATQDGVLIGTLTKDTDGFYKMQPAEDPWAEIDAQAGLIEEAIKALENKFIEAGVKGIDYGEVTITAMTKNIIVSHGLGEVPIGAFLVSGQAIKSTDYPNTYLNINGQNIWHNLTGTQFTDDDQKNITLNEDTVDFFVHKDSTTFALGTYYWFAVAGGAQ